MCIDLFVPGSCIDIPFLLEQIWLSPRSKTPDELNVTEVYDIRIYNRKGNPPISEIWALFPNDCTVRKHGRNLLKVEAWPVTPDVYNDMKQYEWAFAGKPKWTDQGRTMVSRSYTVDPPDPRGRHVTPFPAKVLIAKPAFPRSLKLPHQNILSNGGIRKTLVCLKLQGMKLAEAEEGWLRLKVEPTKLDQHQAKPRRAFGGVDSKLLSQRLTVTCPLLVRDRLQVLLDNGRLENPGPEAKVTCQEVRDIVFNKGIFQAGTSTRIADHRVAVIADVDVDFWDTACTTAASYYGVIPFYSDELTGLWWGCGSDRNIEHDLVHNAMRVIDMLTYLSRAEAKKELARDLAPSGKHEAFCTLLDKMVEVELLRQVGTGNQGELLELVEDIEEYQDERISKLRKLYSKESMDEQILLLSEFSDLHPFRIDYRAIWYAEDIEKKP